jgi:hypothetical protein
LRNAESREAAGEAIYAALFDAAPSLQSLFKTPRAVMAMRFMNGLNNIIAALKDPKALKVVVETLGFQHLDLEVTGPRTVIFRDAITDLISVELGTQFTKKSRLGWRTFLNYVGGSYIYIRATFAVRLKILNSSWSIANKRDEEGEGVEGAEDAAKAEAEGDANKASAGDAGASGGENSVVKDMKNGSVPTTFNDMFMFNAAVMGFRKPYVEVTLTLARVQSPLTYRSRS